MGDAAQSKATWALKAGIGKTSGLGEFWNLELAQKSLLLPIGVVAATRRGVGLGFELGRGIRKG